MRYKMCETTEQVCAYIPEDLKYLKSLILDNIRVASVWVDEVPMAGNRYLGKPVVPLDLPFSLGYLEDSPLDGPSFFCQIDLASIPEESLLPGAPTVGMIWVVLDLSAKSIEIHGGWNVVVHHDARPIECMQWQDPLSVTGQAEWSRALMVGCPDAVLGSSDDDLEREYSNFEQTINHIEHAYFGGYSMPIQGDFDDYDATVVCSFHSIPFVGDMGSVQIHWSPVQGWFGTAETH